MNRYVQTVLGQINPDELGITLTHEHLFHEIKISTFKQPSPKGLQDLESKQICIENLGVIRQYPYCVENNIIFCDEDVRNAVLHEMHDFKKHGGGTIVDNGSIGIRGKDQVDVLKKLSQETHINIVTGTGFYVNESQSLSMLKMSEEEMENKIKSDLLIGIDGTDTKCGVIGEIGCSYPMQPFEKKSLISAAVVQEELRCPVIIHPGRNSSSPSEIIRIFQEAGGIVSRTVMSHLDRAFFTKEDLVEFAALGSYCEYDLFGVEASHYQLNEAIDMPSDAQRIEYIRYLIEQGYGERILISHDIHTKHRLVKFGGHGYSHILINVMPKMLNRGISEENIKQILISNPKKWLTFDVAEKF